MKKQIVAAVGAICVFCIVLSANAREPKHEGRIGELLITTIGVQETRTVDEDNFGKRQITAKPGFHHVRFTIVIRNVGKDAVCTLLKSSLEGTLNFEDRYGTIRLKSVGASPMGLLTSISQFLPGEEIQGEILFTDIRDGIQPLKLHIEQKDENQGCSKEHPIRAYPKLNINVATISAIAE